MIRAHRAFSNNRRLLGALVLFAVAAGCEAGFTARPYHVVPLDGDADESRVELRPIHDVETELGPVERDVALGAPIEPEAPVFNGFQWVEEPELILFNETQLLAPRPGDSEGEGADRDPRELRMERLGPGYAVQFSQRGPEDPASRSLLVVMQGGNGCVAELACSGTYNYDGLGTRNRKYWDVAEDDRHPLYLLNAQNGGIDDTDDDRGELEADLFEDRRGNPFAGWNYAFLPYFSGDNWIGDSEADVVFFEVDEEATDYRSYLVDRDVLGDTPRYQFRGVHNVRTMLARLAPTFAHVDRVVILGYSAGGTGATYHLERFVRAFEAARASTGAPGGGPRFAVIADSAPHALDDDMSSGGKIKGLPVCLQRRMRNMYRADRGMPVACPDCADEPGGAFSNRLSEYMLRTYPDTPLSFITSPHDETLQLVFGAGRVALDRDETTRRACARVDHGVSLQEFLFARVKGFRKKLFDLFDWATNDIGSDKLSVFVVDLKSEPAIKATMNHVWTIRSGFVFGVPNAETGLRRHPTGDALYPCATPGGCERKPVKKTLQNHLRRVVESM